MKPAEQQFLRAVLDAHGGPHKNYRKTAPYPPMADEIAKSIGQNPKQAMRWVEKWEDRGWWESGVTTRTGWFTPEGYAAATEAVRALEPFV